MQGKGNVKFVDAQKTGFYTILKKRVDAYFTENNISKHANTIMVSKTIIMLSAYLLPFIVLLVLQPSLGWSLLIWSFMGVSVAGIGMSVMHDANHGAYSADKRVNTLVGSTLNLLGGSVFNWKLQHNIMHHTYTNITHMDEDIQDRLVLKFSPHTDTKKYHRFQWMYAFLFYGLLTLYWAVAKDFIQFAQFTKNGVNPHSRKENTIIIFKIIGIKIFYFGLMIGLPLVAGIPFLQVLTGFLVMHFFAGLILTTVFQLAHTLEHTAHPMPDENGIIHDDWAIHQLKTTVNFAPNNKFISWYVGGLNYQVEHHLFQKISHVHYPAIAPIVKQTAAEFGVPYLVNDTFGKALRSHIAYLKEIGKLPNLNEVMG
jgi:linoleoyl-CoA desaturase